MVVLHMIANKFFLLIGFALFVVIFLLIRSNNTFEGGRRLQLNEISKLIEDRSSKQACKHPFLPLNSPEINKFISSVPPLNCNAGLDWVICKESLCYVQEQAITRYGKITCTFTDIIRVDDFKVEDGEVTKTNAYRLEKTDVVRVACKSKEGMNWKRTLVGIRQDKSLNITISRENANSTSKLNILMFGFDSLSRNTFIRKLPKSYEYLTKTLKADVLLGYNIVGDGTPQALIPILTGKTELELPDTRKKSKHANYVNVYPFIWNSFKASGYVTGFYEDVPHIGTFSMRLRGFDEPPTDHYMRPYYIAATPEWRRDPKLCAGSIPRHTVMLNHVRNFFSVYKTKPKFLFAFHGELSHDSYNLIGVADDDFVEFLRAFRTDGYLDNTLLIVMADHGHRFAGIRSTIQGKQEERLPFFSFTFPRSFKEMHREMYNNFLSNLDKLTTPFDIHATMRNLLDLKYVEESSFAYSLLTKIPPQRSCSDAKIEPHWCACLEWQSVDLSDPLIDKLTAAVITAINNYTADYRSMCAELSLSKVVWASEMKPNENLIRFSKSSDEDGFKPDLSAKKELETKTYQIKVELAPGNSPFEASISYVVKRDEYKLKLEDISRTNMYRQQAKCVEQQYPHLRKYCYCTLD